MVTFSPSLAAERKHWWMTNKKMVEKYVRDARSLVTTQQPSDATAALGLIEAALAISPRLEAALELKARCLLFLRRFRDVADMLQEYIPSRAAGGAAPAASDESDSFTSISSASSTSSDQSGGSHRAKLLPTAEKRSSDGKGLARCFSIGDVTRKVLAGLGRSGDSDGQWRYVMLGQACCHLGLMEDAMTLLQTHRRLATAASRRYSTASSDDSFTLSSAICAPPPPPSQQQTESDAAIHLLSHIKFLLRRRAAALAALDAGLPNESVRHFTKILDGRRGTPHLFAAACLVGRAVAFRAAGRLAESISDLNRALALDPTSIAALRARADILEHVRALPDCLRDLDHLKLIYDSALRDHKLPGPTWRPHSGIRYRDIPVELRSVTNRITEIRVRVGTCHVDYYKLLGVEKGCSLSELERAHLVLTLRHKPEKAAAFVDRLEFADDHRDLDTVRDQARMSARILYRMLQKGYSYIMNAVMNAEAAERERVTVATAKEAVAKAAALKAMAATVNSATVQDKGSPVVAAAAFQGVFCRDIAAVGSLISQSGFGRVIPVKYEGLSC